MASISYINVRGGFRMPERGAHPHQTPLVFFETSFFNFIAQERQKESLGVHYLTSDTLSRFKVPVSEKSPVY